MKVAVTGTPGTGKTTATDRLDGDYSVVHLNDVIEREGFATGRDEERGSLVADLEAVAGWLDGRSDVVFESHLAHHFDADRVAVLRCEPTVLEGRLRDRGADDAKVAENAESEALDVILSEAVTEHGQENVYEIDTTDRSPAEVATAIGSVIDGTREPSAGTVSFVDYL